MSGYIGVNGKAQNIEKMYVGIAGKAKEVKAGFIGVNGKAKQFYSAAPPVIEEMSFTITSGTFKMTASGKNLELVINDESYPVVSGRSFSKNVSAGTAVLKASKITNISFLNNTAIQTIESPFPSVARSVTNFSSCFYSCTSLTTIPAGLFDNCTAVTDFSYCFYSCTSLTTIPEGLFDNCTAVTNFSNCFNSCTSLTTIPAGLFDNCTAVTDFSYCFKNCSNIVSSVPELWDSSKWARVTSKSSCYLGCTSAANYADIPKAWK